MASATAIAMALASGLAMPTVVAQSAVLATGSASVMP